MLGRKMESERAIEKMLSESDRQALNEMRKGIYMSGLEGGAAGFLAGVVGFRAASHLEAVKKLKLERKHAFATPLVTFAAGMMLGSMVAARNHAHTLHYIMQKYSKPELSPYQERVATFKELGSSVDPHYDKHVGTHDHEADLDDPLIKLFRANDEMSSSREHAPSFAAEFRVAAPDFRHTPSLRCSEVALDPAAPGAQKAKAGASSLSLVVFAGACFVLSAAVSRVLLPPPGPRDFSCGFSGGRLVCACGLFHYPGLLVSGSPSQCRGV
ncbi:Hypothetical Protein FCC1311_103252 [Hondaea fermentalgiana]|uniref:Transmembrane protein n=1 Tax=Hondaea fermentalgiana TaxID=2315210 RepID=A0A2R5GTB5_9STRA|nr:Hypothetical Protein FCC1311_103252 [Hondaea fermentalgiana]|eukprot:GBG34102.1 Hypothetical Protein FCC1311_103252 [Hondaea fermentalgiana]